MHLSATRWATTNEFMIKFLQINSKNFIVCIQLCSVCLINSANTIVRIFGELYIPRKWPTFIQHRFLKEKMLLFFAFFAKFIWFLLFSFSHLCNQ